VSSAIALPACLTCLPHFFDACLPCPVLAWPCRKILRQLYATPLRECYLFKKCGVKFLDALMLGARVELFLPKVGAPGCWCCCKVAAAVGKVVLCCTVRAYHRCCKMV
jgi:hypothetical protein